MMLATENITVLWSLGTAVALSSVNRWGELRMPRCVRIANCHEHTAVFAPVKNHAVFLPELLEGTLIVG